MICQPASGAIQAVTLPIRAKLGQNEAIGLGNGGFDSAGNSRKRVGAVEQQGNAAAIGVRGLRLAAGHAGDGLGNSGVLARCGFDEDDEKVASGVHSECLSGGVVDGRILSRSMER